MILRTIADMIRKSIFARHPLLSFASSSVPDTIDEDGLWIGKRRRGGRFIRYPNGEIRQVDRDFDPSVFDDPDSVPAGEAAEAGQPDVSEIVGTSAEAVKMMARATLASNPSSLIAIYYDAKGMVIGSTITPAKRGLTAAVFRASLRALPARAKQVTFVAGSGIASDVRDAATEAAEVCLVRVLDFISD